MPKLALPSWMQESRATGAFAPGAGAKRDVICQGKQDPVDPEQGRAALQEQAAHLDAAGWNWTGSGEEAPRVISGIGSSVLSQS